MSCTKFYRFALLHVVRVQKDFSFFFYVFFFGEEKRVPFFSGARPCGMKCDASPGPKFGPMKLDAVKPRAPMFSIAARQTGSAKSCGPGPKYKYCYGCFKCAPKFTFGIRHSDCAPPLITECDEKC